MKPCILCVDDESLNLRVLVGILQDVYDVKIAKNGVQALKVLESNAVDLILMDIMMPEMDGIEACQRIKSTPEWAEIPLLFITAKSSPVDEEQALREGGDDFVSKPFHARPLMARIATQLKLRQARLEVQESNLQLQSANEMLQLARKDLEYRNENLNLLVEKRVGQIQKMQQASVTIMMSLAETRDDITGNHIKRTQKYVEVIAKQLAQSSRFSALLDDNKIMMMTQAAPLHDIGKIAIPDSILMKPGKLTDEEFEQMKTHAQIGYDIVHKAHEIVDDDAGEYLTVAEQIILSHHEKWDGSGYPQQLSGEQIPLSARIMAVADVYDALTTERPYKKAFSQEKAFNIMREGAGKHFQPEMLEIFFSMSDKLLEIQENNRD